MYLGTHPEYEERLQQLIDKREQTLEKARLYRDYRLECVEKMFDAEQRQVEEDYLVYFYKICIGKYKYIIFFYYTN